MITRAEFISTAADLHAADREINASPDKYKTVKQPKPKPDKPKRTDTSPTVSAYCRRCIYLCKNPALCSFAYYTGTTRPCPAGDGCIVRKTKGDRKC